MIDDKNVLIEIEEEERKQSLSIPAKRLREKLLPLKSKEEQTAKRWFWELLQNASDYNQTVDILLEINDNHVTFRHTGNPFSIQDVLNLISPILNIFLVVAILKIMMVRLNNLSKR